MDFLELVHRRRSVRKYADRPVAPDHLDYVLNCTRFAPSAVNRQPWRFVVVKSEAAKAHVVQSYNREWIRTAPMFIIVCATPDEAWTRKSDNKNHADIDCAIAIEHLCLAAASVGLGTCWVCNFDPVLLRTLPGLPADCQPVAIVPIGYPDESETLAPGVRKELSETVITL